MELIIALITFLISLGLIIAIFQMNSRLDRVRVIQVEQMEIQKGLLDLERFRFMKELIAERRLADDYLALVEGLNALSPADTAWLRQVRGELEAQGKY